MPSSKSPAVNPVSLSHSSSPMSAVRTQVNEKSSDVTTCIYSPHLGYIHGPGALFKVDKVTGEFTEIGPTVWQDEVVTDWMDLAFDSRDRLWGTTQNKLFRIDTATGAILEVVPILGVPGDPPPPPYTTMQEVMAIAFDKDDVLYGTVMNVEWDTGHGSPVLRMNTSTGQVTLLGYTEKPYNHGGDIMPTRVRVCHRLGNGSYQTLTIAMDALSAHLAHGDIVSRDCGE